MDRIEMGEREGIIGELMSSVVVGCWIAGEDMKG